MKIAVAQFVIAAKLQIHIVNGKQKEKNPVIITYQSQLKTNSVFPCMYKQCCHSLSLFLCLFPEDSLSNSKKRDVERCRLKRVSLSVLQLLDL